MEENVNMTLYNVFALRDMEESFTLKIIANRDFLADEEIGQFKTLTEEVDHVILKTINKVATIELSISHHDIPTVQESGFDELSPTLLNVVVVALIMAVSTNRFNRKNLL